MPIAAGERIFTKWGFREILEKGAATILQPDLSHAATAAFGVAGPDCGCVLATGSAFLKTRSQFERTVSDNFEIVIDGVIYLMAFTDAGSVVHASS